MKIRTQSHAIHPIIIKDLRMMVRKQKSRRQRNLPAFTPPSLTKLNRKRKTASKKHPASIFLDTKHPFITRATETLVYITNVPIAPLLNAPFSKFYTAIPSGYEEIIRKNLFTKSQNCEKTSPKKPSSSPQKINQRYINQTSSTSISSSETSNKSTIPNHTIHSISSSTDTMNSDDSSSLTSLPAYIKTSTHDRGVKQIDNDNKLSSIEFFTKTPPKNRKIQTNEEITDAYSFHTGKSTLIEREEEEKRMKEPGPFQNIMTFLQKDVHRLLRLKKNRQWLISSYDDEIKKKAYFFYMKDNIPHYYHQNTVKIDVTKVNNH